MRAISGLDAELLSLLLQAGAGRDAIEIAPDVLAKVGGVAGLTSARERDLRLPGIGPARSAILLGAVELVRRLARIRMARRDLLDRPDAVASYLSLRYMPNPTRRSWALSFSTSATVWSARATSTAAP